MATIAVFGALDTKGQELAFLKEQIEQRSHQTRVVDVRVLVGVKDIMMIPAIVDISGLNRISRGVFARAAAAVCGMVEARVPEGDDDKPTIVASMFGNTTKCVEAARAIVEREGFEVL